MNKGGKAKGRGAHRRRRVLLVCHKDHLGTMLDKEALPDIKLTVEVVKDFASAQELLAQNCYDWVVTLERIPRGPKDSLLEEGYRLADLPREGAKEPREPRWRTIVLIDRDWQDLLFQLAPGLTIVRRECAYREALLLDILRAGEAGVDFLPPTIVPLRLEKLKNDRLRLSLSLDVAAHGKGPGSAHRK